MAPNLWIPNGWDTRELMTTLWQIVYDPRGRCQRPLTPYPLEEEKENSQDKDVYDDDDDDVSDDDFIIFRQPWLYHLPAIDDKICLKRVWWYVCEPWALYLLDRNLRWRVFEKPTLACLPLFLFALTTTGFLCFVFLIFRRTFFTVVVSSSGKIFKIVLNCSGLPLIRCKSIITDIFQFVPRLSQTSGVSYLSFRKNHW